MHEKNTAVLENFVLRSRSMLTAATIAPPRSEGTWLEETRYLLVNRPARIKLKDISEACDVSIPWLSKLQTGVATDVSIQKVQRVNNWLRENVVNA